MPLSAFIRALPGVEVPFPETDVRTHALRSEAGLVVFFTFLRDFDLPPHSHGAQWGTVLEGSIEFTIGGVTRRYGPGESYDIPAGTVHSARIPAGTVAMDVFEEPDRYPMRG